MKTNKKTVIGILTAVIISAADTQAGRWLSRDPIEDGSGFVERESIGEAGGNLYAFVGNDAANTIDPLGLNFIAVGDRYVTYTPGLFRHMSIEYFEERCPRIAEGTRFTVDTEPNSRPPSDSFELQPLLQMYRHFFTVRPRPTATPVSTFVWDLVSEIRRSSTPHDFVVIYADLENHDAHARWQTIIMAATSYPYGEQQATRGTLAHWPNSRYVLFANNSNTFIREMARAIGRNADVAGGSHPGNIFAVPVPDPGYVPIFSPWGN